VAGQEYSGKIVEYRAYESLKRAIHAREIRKTAKKFVK
jgi:hypothetical protein